MKYDGSRFVVAHPPCSRWCRLAGLVEARWGHKRGEDGGMFAKALESVRRNGGVLEHPAFSDAWAAFDLPRPATSGDWIRGKCGGFSCYVEQWRYGHAAKKATWVYAFGRPLPRLRFGSISDGAERAWVSWCGNNVRNSAIRPRLGAKAAKATPIEFRETLIAIASGDWSRLPDWRSAKEIRQPTAQIGRCWKTDPRPTI